MENSGIIAIEILLKCSGNNTHIHTQTRTSVYARFRVFIRRSGVYREGEIDETVVYNSVIMRLRPGLYDSL